MIICPRCKLPQENEYSCEYCGFWLSSEYISHNNSNYKKFVPLVLGIGIILFGVLLFYLIKIRTPQYIPARIDSKYSIKTENEELDRMALRNMSCLLKTYTIEELKRMSDEEIKKEMLLCSDIEKGPLLYPKGSKYDWSKPSDGPKQKIWGYEIPLDSEKRKQYFEDMEEENRRLENEILGHTLD